MKHWIMDYETLSNCFVAVFEHYKTNKGCIHYPTHLKKEHTEKKESK